MSQCVLFCHVIKFVIEAALEMSVIVKWIKKKLTEMIIFKQGFVIKNVENTWRRFNLLNCSNTYNQKRHENQKLRLGLERWRFM
jgi:hypothetical protein